MKYEFIKPLFKGSFSESQMKGLQTIIEECGDIDIRHTAYILATIFHETGRKMQPVEEASYLSKEKQTAYLQKQKYYPYHGRDLCHTTWDYNYQKVKDFYGIDVVAEPELIAEMPLAAKVAVHFMQQGHYTTKKLSDYFNDQITDPIWARSIINGRKTIIVDGKKVKEKYPDQAELIAGYYEQFYKALL